MELLGGRRLDYRPLRSPREPRVGVHGFLLFTCIFMVFIGPGLLLFNYREFLVKMDLTDIPLFTALRIIQDLTIVTFGFVAGILLWKGKRAGLLLARTFFIARAGLGLLGMASYALLQFNKEFSMVDVEFRSAMSGFAIGSAITAGFIVYLFGSARVKSTYPKTAPEADEPPAADQTQGQ